MRITLNSAPVGKEFNISCVRDDSLRGMGISEGRRIKIIDKHGVIICKTDNVKFGICSILSDKVELENIND
jgi:hypothetical protein